MEYAIVRTGGKQYRVSAGDILEVAKIDAGGDSTVSLEDVLLWVSGSQIKIGKPKLAGVSVNAKILEQKKGEKIRVSKFKAKSRYRRTIGFRALLTKIQIENISGSAKVASPKVKKKPIRKTSAKK